MCYIKKRCTSKRPYISLSFYIMPRNSVYRDKNNENIESVNIFENTYRYTLYADDSTSFLKKLNSIKELLNTVEIFSSFTRLKPNLSKCKISGKGASKWGHCGSLWNKMY